MIRAFVGLGANLGDARAAVEGGFEALASLPGSILVARSPLYVSAPVDASGPDFVNAVAALDTTLDAAALLATLHRLEAMAGRERPYANAPRTLDLDLLLYGDAVSHDPALVLPHPRLHLRAFVLEPLLALAPGLAHPRLGPLARWRDAAAGQRVQKLA